MLPYLHSYPRLIGATVMKAAVIVFTWVCAIILAPTISRADLVLSYDVNIVQTSVNVGDTIDWQVFATISGTPNGSNLGIAQVSVTLQESLNETLTPGTVDPAFAGYANQSGGTPFPGGLLAVGANHFPGQFAGAVGNGTTGSFLIASGQYTATQAGIHTLQGVVADASKYFSALGQTTAAAPSYDTVSFGSDSVTVTAVPEPSSLVLTGIAALGAWRLRRRKAATLVAAGS